MQETALVNILDHDDSLVDVNRLHKMWKILNIQVQYHDKMINIHDLQ